MKENNLEIRMITVITTEEEADLWTLDTQMVARA